MYVINTIMSVTNKMFSCCSIKLLIVCQLKILEICYNSCEMKVHLYECCVRDKKTENTRDPRVIDAGSGDCFPDREPICDPVVAAGLRNRKECLIPLAESFLWGAARVYYKGVLFFWTQKNFSCVRTGLSLTSLFQVPCITKLLRIYKLHISVKHTDGSHTDKASFGSRIRAANHIIPIIVNDI